MLKNLCCGAVALVVISASLVLAQSGSGSGGAGNCANFETISSCASAASQPSPKLCVWDDTAGCITDPCLQYSENTTCAKGPGCLWMGWSLGAPCFASYLLCANLGTANCGKYPFCTIREKSYCGTVGVIGVITTTTQCDVSFPTWSIALIIVWLIIMVILGLIVLLAMGKSKAQKITGVEGPGDVVVDAVQIRDNFQLGDPLNQPSDE